MFFIVIGVPLLVNDATGIARVLGGPARLAFAALSAVYWAVATIGIDKTARHFPLAPGSIPAAALAHVVGVALATLGFSLVAAASAILGGRSFDAAQGEMLLDYSISESITLYLAVLVVMTLMHTHEQRRAAELKLAELERLATTARLTALQAQLRPHFLFNALNTVAMAVRRGNQGNALQVVLDLSGLLRGALAQPTTELISLADELAFVESFLRIEQARYGERLRINIEVAPSALNAGVPAMILQPLVENATRHGIGASADAGNVAVRAHVVDGQLEIEVEDDGPGFPPDWREGIGLDNVRSRLQVHFGSEADMHVDRTDSGALVRLRLPHREIAP